MESIDEIAFNINSIITKRKDEGIYYGLPQKKRFCILGFQGGEWFIHGQFTRKHRSNKESYKVIELDVWHILVDYPKTVVENVLPKLTLHPLYPYK
jgi:hypothetical protein